MNPPPYRSNPMRDFPAEVAAWARILFGAAELEPQPGTDAPPAVFAAALAAFDAGAVDHKALAGPVKEATGASGKHFFKPLRMALTGRAEGPELGALLAVMPRDTIRARLARHAQS